MNGYLPETTSYFIESYIPHWLTRDDAYKQALVNRLEKLMDMQDFTAVSDVELFLVDSPDCPPEPGMVTIRAEVRVKEFDIQVPLTDQATSIPEDVNA